MSEKNDMENKVEIKSKIETDEYDFIEPEPKRFDLNMAVKVGIFLLLAIIVILLLTMINNGNNVDGGNIPDFSRTESSRKSTDESSVREAVSETTEQPSQESKEVSLSEVSEVSRSEVSKETSRLKMLVVDRVVNKSQSEAEKILKEKGFKVKVNELYSDEVKKGDVISQIPAYFTLLEEGGTITIDVSLGNDPAKEKADNSIAETAESQVSVISEPDVHEVENSRENSKSSNVILSYDIPVINIAGREKNDAENILKSQGFKVQTVYMSSPNVRKGYVIEQSPAGGD